MVPAEPRTISGGSNSSTCNPKALKSWRSTVPLKERFALVGILVGAYLPSTVRLIYTYAKVRVRHTSLILTTENVFQAISPGFETLGLLIPSTQSLDFCCSTWEGADSGFRVFSFNQDLNSDHVAINNQRQHTTSTHTALIIPTS